MKNKKNEVEIGEWNRLAKDAYNSLEFLVTMHYLRKHLPETGKILDAGGGPGRYALEFCRAGYDVVLLDIDPTYTVFAEEKIKLEPKAVSSRLIASVVGDVRNLSRFDTNDFDAVLCLGGPLTHISDATERIQATSELVRVAKTWRDRRDCRCRVSGDAADGSQSAQSGTDNTSVLGANKRRKRQ